MNRIDLVSNVIQTSPGGTCSARLDRPHSRDVSTCHALFAPLHYEPGYAYPLVVWLHGPRDNERQLNQVMPLVSMRNYVAAAPRGTEAEDADQGCGGYHWQQSENHILLAEQRVLACVELACDRFNVAPARIFLAGLGCGGTMAMRIALNNPGRFAGALSLGGPFPTNHCPLRYLNQVRDLPLFIASGCQSKTYPQQQLCRDLRLFHAAGMSTTLRHYPGDDELTTLMLADMDRWIMAQICPSAASCEQG